jgi:hypothetical protein
VLVRSNAVDLSTFGGVTSPRMSIRLQKKGVGVTSLRGLVTFKVRGNSVDPMGSYFARHAGAVVMHVSPVSQPEGALKERSFKAQYSGDSGQLAVIYEVDLMSKASHFLLDVGTPGGMGWSDGECCGT